MAAWDTEVPSFIRACSYAVRRGRCRARENMAEAVRYGAWTGNCAATFARVGRLPGWVFQQRREDHRRR